MAASKIQAENLTRKGLGRPKGSLNRTTTVAKDILSDVADRLGGSNRLYAWVLADPDNEKAFWTGIWPKLLPLQIGGDQDAPLVTIVERRIVRSSKPSDD